MPSCFSVVELDLMLLASQIKMFAFGKKVVCTLLKFEMPLYTEKACFLKFTCVLSTCLFLQKI